MARRLSPSKGQQHSANNNNLRQKQPSEPSDTMNTQTPRRRDSNSLTRHSLAISGIYLFTLETLAIALVFTKALHTNAGHKYIRVKQPGCDVAWAEMNSDHASIACCSHSDPHDPERWDASLCGAATSMYTAHLTSRLAVFIPFVTLMLNHFFTWVGRQPREVKVAQRRRFGLYFFVIFFRTAVLLMLLNRFQAFVQTDESTACWYSDLRHDGRCRERFDFADHGVLFISQYLVIQTFELLAVLQEATSVLHLCVCVVTACIISLFSLVGFYDTVSFFHTRVESTTALILSLLTVQLPLMLIASDRFQQKWLRLRHFIKEKV